MGLLRAPRRWPRHVPYAVSMAFPTWLTSGSLQAVPDLASLRTASAPAPVGDCGTFDFWMRRAALYQELGPLSVSSELTFQMSLSGRFGRSSAALPFDWSREIVVPVVLVDGIDDAVTPVDSERLRDAVRSSLGASWFSPAVDEGQRVSLEVLLDIDTLAYPEVLETALSLEVEAVRGGEVLARTSLSLSFDDDLWLKNSVHDVPVKAFAGAVLPDLPLPDPRDASALAEWSLAVRGVSAGVLRLGLPESRWSGEVAVPLGEALARERARAKFRGAFLLSRPK